MRFNKLLFFIAALFFVLGVTKVKATHIVGGEMYYERLSGNNYAVRLVIYRDCYNGVPPFDNPACVEIFDQNNASVAIYNPLVGADSVYIPNTINNPCFIPPTNVCYVKATYNFIINLPPSSGIYYLVYQRCCRNQTISNIFNPGATGATYVAEIRLSNLYVNSNPVFKNLPPPFICTNYQFTFDNSATDVDGDSLVYSLINPLTGADTLSPQPCPLNPPPYGNVSYINPPYSVTNMLNGSAGGAALSIDPQTGLLTAIPNTIGQFVIGIAVKEYRNGVYLGQTRRDYQLNVLPCPSLVVAAFLNPLTVCGSLTAQFTNGSFGASSYFWNFGDGATSTATNPSHTYADTGTYNITLIAYSAFNPGCADTINGVVHIYPPLETDFSVFKDSCTNQFYFNDTIIGTGTISNVFWQFGDGATSIVNNPSHAYTLSGNYTVTYIATSTLGCKDTVIKQITALPLLNVVSSTISNISCNGLCNGAATFIVGTGFSVASIQWNDPTNSTNDSIFNLCPGTYMVVVTDTNGCIDSATVSINQPAPLGFTVSGTSAYCDGRCIGTASAVPTGGTPPYNYLWNDSSTTSFINNLCQGTYYINVTDANGCTTNPDSVIIVYSDSIPPLDAVIDRDTIYQGESANITSTINSAYVYNWNPPTWLSSSTVSNPVTTPESTIVYQLTITDSLGCPNRDSVKIFVINYVCEEPGIFIPNAFSPNSDLTNDVLYVRGGQIKELLLRVYDRWGEKVFETTTPGTGWNGTYKGKKVMPGVFVYYLDATCFNNEKFFKKGNITVLK